MKVTLIAGDDANPVIFAPLPHPVPSGGNSLTLSYGYPSRTVRADPESVFHYYEDFADGFTGLIATPTARAGGGSSDSSSSPSCGGGCGAGFRGIVLLACSLIGCRLIRRGAARNTRS
jgi:hypothetical protein